MGGSVLRDMTENTGVKCWEGAAHVTCEGGNSWETQVKALNMQCTPKHPLPHPHPSKWWWLNDNYIIHTESMDTTRGLWRCMGYQLYITEVLEQRYDMEEDNRHGVVDSPIVCYQSPVMMMQPVTAGVIHSTFCTLSYKYKHKYKYKYKYSIIVCVQLSLSLGCTAFVRGFKSHWKTVTIFNHWVLLKVFHFHS